jgi:hypothetical protein
MSKLPPGSHQPPPALTPRPAAAGMPSTRLLSSSTHLSDARRASIAMQESVEMHLDQVQSMYNEFFDDAGFDLTHPSGNPKRATLADLVNYVKTIPTPGRPALFDRGKTAEMRAQSAVAKFQSLGSLIHTQAVDRALFRQDFIVCGISMLGVVLMGIASLVGWSPRQRLAGAMGSCSGRESGYRAGEIDNTRKVTIFVLTCLILASSLVSVFFIVAYYMMITRAKQIEWCKLNGKEIMKRGEAYNFWRSRYPLYMMFEILVHLIIPYPFYYSQTEVTTGVNNSKYLELFMLMRVYTILRVLHHGSPLYRLRHDIVAATPELKRANFTVRFTDTMKVYCYDYTVTFALVLYAFVALIGGFAVFVAERDSNNGCDPKPAYPGVDGYGFNSWFDGVYFMVVSVRTIGYGDLKPITIVGRLAAIVFTFSGMFVEAFLGSVVINKIAQSREEKVIDEYLESINAYVELRVASAMLIQALWKSSKRYKYRHNMISRKEMEEALRKQKRRKDFLNKIKTATIVFQVPTYANLHDEVEALKLVGGANRGPETDTFATDVALRTIINHFKNSSVPRASQKIRRAYTADASSTRDRMPYLKRQDRLYSSADLVKRHRLLFTQDLDLHRWAEKAKVRDDDEANHRTFTATKRVVGKQGERRIPVGEGHKADILLEARKKFREARLRFTGALSSSADFVIDQKLLLIFQLLSAASEKVTRNAIALHGIRKTMRLQLTAVDELATIALSGGDF